MTSKHIVVIGAGYAGLSAATRAGRGGARVTLVAPESRLLHRIRLHETAAGREVPRPTIAHVLRGRPVTHLQARVTELDLAGRKVFTDTGETLAYDTLVYALGSRTSWQDVPGAAEHAYSAERAAELSRRIQDAPVPGTVAVVGGGATGIELAAELAEAHPDWQVRIVAAGAVGGHFSERGRAHVRKVLDGLGVTLHEHTAVTAVTADRLETAAGPVPADLVVWAASLEVHPLAAEAGLAVTANGQAVVDDHLRSVSHPDVHVVGDAAAVVLPGIGRLRMACATAQPMGSYVGRLLAGRTTGPFKYRYATQCLSLGRREALVQLIHADDSMRQGIITGPLGRLTKALIVNAVPLSLR
ncbi:NAD(P)/FAD-dependent oxidoreductase [Kitasatospora terrestris]|uniref:FAD-dependent oxidoreductase n=1 Tax=Kitasatospora terrestris TaxID=258051 RepID=A0ABP9DJ00_9ACTN